MRYTVFQQYSQQQRLPAPVTPGRHDGPPRHAVHAERSQSIQGSAADIIKIAMINIHQKLNEGNYKSKMLLQVHDELVFDIYKPELEDMKQLIKTEMENAYTLAVPLDVELGMGSNWLEAH